MTIYQRCGDIVLGVSLPLARFPALAHEHRRRFPDMPSVECPGKELRQEAFSESEIRSFVTTARSAASESVRDVLARGGNNLIGAGPDCPAGGIEGEKKARNDKGHLAAPLDSMGLEACHRCLGPAWELPQVLNAPFGNTLNNRTKGPEVKVT